ncbi:MAG: hypothetical protein R3C26_26035 [Calditrichia bacterium]
MNITEQVILDLLPVYQSGDASEDTVKLVETYLAEHPDFAKKIAKALPEIPVEAIAQKHQFIKENEMTALTQTRSLLRWKGIWMGFAIFFSVAPLSCYSTVQVFIGFLKIRRFWRFGIFCCWCLLLDRIFCYTSPS